MFEIILATTLYVTPPQEQNTALRIANIQAAREARAIPREWEPFTVCISKRESGYSNSEPIKSYRAKNPVSSASGRYQFLDSTWRQGGAWNVWKRLIRTGFDRPTAKYVRIKLMATPIRYWKPVWQDILYAEVLLSGQGKGWKHWHLAGSSCNSKVPSKEK